MKFICLIFGLLSIFTLQIDAGLELDKQALDAMSDALDLSKQLLTETVSPNATNEIIQELRLKHGISHVSPEDGRLFGEAITSLMNGQDSHSSAFQNVYEWCSSSKPLLATYKRFLSNSESLATQKTILLTVLRNAIDTLTEVKANLNAFSSSLREATGKIAVVKDHAKNVDDASNKAIQSLAETTGAKLNRALTGSDESNGKLENQIETLKNKKAQFETIESISSTPELRTATIDSTQKLITNIAEYLNIPTV